MSCFVLLLFLLPAASAASLSDAFARASPGDTIRIDPGTYTPGNLVLSASNVVVQGVGMPTLLGSSLAISGADNVIDGIRFADGGPVVISGPRAVVRHSVFSNCSSPANGGALSILSGGSGAELVNVTAASCVARGLGGALYSIGATVRVRDSRFWDNAAARGGAIFAASGSLSVMGASELRRNRATVQGGAIAMPAGTLWVGGTTTCASNAGASLGGCILFQGSALVLNGSALFEANVAATAGGAVCVFAASRVLVQGDVAFVGNRVQFGGGIFMLRNGVLTLDGRNTSFRDHRVSSGGGIYADAQVTTRIVGGVWMENNTAAFNGGGLYVSASNTVVLDGKAWFVRNNAFGGGGGGMFIIASSFVASGSLGTASFLGQKESASEISVRSVLAEYGQLGRGRRPKGGPGHVSADGLRPLCEQHC